MALTAENYLPTTPGSATPEQLAQAREYAQVLLSPHSKGGMQQDVKHWTQGLSNVVSALAGGYEMGNANRMERQRNLNLQLTPDNGAGTGPATEAPPGVAAVDTKPVEAGTIASSSVKPVSARGIGPTAMAITEQGETGKTGMEGQHNIYPDTNNSKSYGVLGLNSKTGSAAQFAKMHPELGFAAQPGTPQFDAEWKAAAQKNPDGLYAAQADWHEKNILAPLRGRLEQINPKIGQDPRVLAYLADRRVQMGDVGWDRAAQLAASAVSPEDYINKLSQSDKQNLGRDFKTYLSARPQDIKGLHNRIDLRSMMSLDGGGEVPSGGAPEAISKALGGPVSAGSLPQGAGAGSQLAMLAPQGGAGAGQPPPVGQVPPGQENASAAATTPPPASPPQDERQQFAQALQNRGPGTQPAVLPPAYDAQLDLTQRYNQLVRNGVPPQVAMQTATQYVKSRMEAMPKQDFDPWGQRVTTSPGGEKRIVPGTAPGHPGKPVEADGLTIAFDRIGPDGQVRRHFLNQAGQGQTQPGQPGQTKQPGLAPTPGNSGSTGNNQSSPQPGVMRQPKTPEEKADPSFYVQAAIDANPKKAQFQDPRLDPNATPDSQINSKAVREEFFKREEAKTTANIKRSEDAQAAIGNALESSNKLNDDINIARNVITDPRTAAGAGAEWLSDIKNMASGLKNNFGLDFLPVDEKRLANDAARNEVLTKVLSGSVLTSLRPFLGPNAGQFRVAELDLVKKAWGNQNMSRPGQLAVVAIMEKMNGRVQVLGQMAQDYASKNGGILDEGFYKASQAYLKNNQILKTSDEYKEWFKAIEEKAAETENAGRANPVLPPGNPPAPNSGWTVQPVK